MRFTMANNTRVLVLGVLIRLFIFNTLLLLTCAFDGVPNINSVVLMFSLILVIPLPRLEPVLYILDEFYTITSIYLRIVRKLLSWIYSFVFIPLLVCLTPLVRWAVFQCLTLDAIIRRIMPLLKAVLQWLVPSFVSTMLFSFSEIMAAATLPWARCICWFINGPLRWIHSIFSYVRNLQNDSNETYSSFSRCFVLLVLSVTALIIALPSPVSVLNYLVTGYGYPGSTIRFHYCPTLRKTNVISYLFLEVSYPMWNITRTINFYLFSKYLFHGSWSIHINIKNQIGPGYSTWLMGYSRMLCVGLVTPFVLPFQCFEQVINNILCTVCHIAFLTILNGHTRVNFFMIYYGVCSICVHAESTLVALASTLHSLRLTVNDHVTTIICMMELYLMIHVSLLTCKIIWRKIKAPHEDVLWENCSHTD